jgi:hypothetical protein
MGGTIEIDSEVNIGTTFTLLKQILMLDTILCIDDDNTDVM